MRKTPPKAPDVVLLNKRDLCSSLGISTQAFDKWGVNFREKRGRECLYSVADVVANRVGHAERKVAAINPDDDPDKPNIDYERYRLTKAQADGQELKNEKERKEVVETAFATFVLGRTAAQMASILDQIPLRIKRKFPDLPPARIDAIKAEIIKAQNIAAEVGGQLEDWLNEYLASAD
ncbi:terminase small subunit [Shewanella algae]|uniref:terminase small subunit n=1 Tax=Shewanella algae TaxID=38313 RepID=UPI001AACEB55|nr:terminase small subunit [Shewanella algae]MBO2556560.1 terminase small subunit [Shewanella algae]MBO2573494.1 terminase small subunit [Shewanella algae]